MKTQQQRAQKRFKRENRDNKGVSTAAKMQAQNYQVRMARQTLGPGLDGADDSMMLMAAALIGKRCLK